MTIASARFPRAFARADPARDRQCEHASAETVCAAAAPDRARRWRVRRGALRSAKSTWTVTASTNSYALMQWHQRRYDSDCEDETPSLRLDRHRRAAAGDGLCPANCRARRNPGEQPSLRASIDIHHPGRDETVRAERTGTRWQRPRGAWPDAEQFPHLRRRSRARDCGFFRGNGRARSGRAYTCGRRASNRGAGGCSRAAPLPSALDRRREREGLSGRERSAPYKNRRQEVRRGIPSSRNPHGHLHRFRDRHAGSPPTPPSARRRLPTSNPTRESPRWGSHIAPESLPTAHTRSPSSGTVRPTGQSCRSRVPRPTAMAVWAGRQR